MINHPDELVKEIERVHRVWHVGQTPPPVFDVAKELERIREETPRFPRWFVVDVYLCEGGMVFEEMPDATIRHLDPGKPEVFIRGCWHGGSIISDRWTLDKTLGLLRPHVREITRAEANLRTGGFP